MTKRAVFLTVPLLGLVAFGFAVNDRNSAADDKEPAKTEASSFTAEQIKQFEKDVLPILQTRCLKCHGGEEKIRGGLRLTSRAALLKGGDQGSAITLEEPGESLFLQAINYDGLEMPPSGRLPKDEVEILTKWIKEGAPWTPGAAPDVPEAHEPAKPSLEEARNMWAYRPLVRPEPPAVTNSSWGANPIDAFILARLEARNLSPVPEADRVALIRRAYYDLTGLPPKPEEVDAFVADTSEDAYERLVDRLLDSPQYGEKWGRHWLDLVRFAETHGYERDSAKPFAWRYRDYVINAFNHDKPYDVFLREQFAGDELDEVTPESLIATGFYRLGLWDDEPADRALAKYDILDGIVATTSQVVLGMTVNCARCHDHKKDPIPQKDYYRLLAFFRDVTDMNVRNSRRIATPAETKEHARLTREKHAREADWHSDIYRIEQRFASALTEKKGIKVGRRPVSDLIDVAYRFYRDTWDRLPEFDSLKHEAAGTISHNFLSLAPASRKEAFGFVFEARLQAPQDGEYTFSYQSTAGLRILLDGKVVLDRPEKGTHAGDATASLRKGSTPLRIEYFNAYDRPDLKLSWSGPGVERRSLTDDTDGEGRVLLADSRKEAQEWAVSMTEPARDWMQPTFSDDSWDRRPGGFGQKGTPGAVVRTDWHTSEIWLRKRFRVESLPEAAVLELHHDDSAEIYLNGSLIHRAKGYTVDYGRVILPPDEPLPLVVGENVIAVHCRQRAGGQYIDVGLSEAPEQLVLLEMMRRYGAEVLGNETHARHRDMSEALEKSRKSPLPEPGIDVMAVEERGRQLTNVLIRGNPGSPGDKVEAGIPVVLDREAPRTFPPREGEAASGKRRALAEWMTSRDNPIAARVLANRLWQYHFGRGIVPTSNDFGKLGEPATHPELLDWLAAELRDGGWTLKRMHRLIMRSSAYRMSSTATPEGLAADAGNSLFWRFNMRRLTAEEVRDSILAASGKLNLVAGGPGVYPPIPAEVLAGQSVPGSGWGKSTPEEASRRSIYIHVKRSLLVPILASHDQADTDSSCPVRYTTTVPTQSLGMLNGEFTQEQSAALAARLQHEHPDDLPAQVARAIRLTTARNPAAREIEQDVAFIRGLQEKGKLSAGDALRHYCLLALNTNEFIYLD